MLRAAGALLLWVRRVLNDRHAPRWTLAWSEHGVLLETHREALWAAREDVVGSGVPDARAPRLAVAALHPLQLVLRARRAPVWWTIPPYFTSNSEVLRARIEHWLDTARARAIDPVDTARPQAPDHARTPPSHAPSAHEDETSRRYERAAQGTPEPDDVVVPEGRGYLRRAPYGGLLALVFVADALRVAGPERTRLAPPALLAALLVVVTLAAWFAWTKRRRAQASASRWC